MIQEKTIEDIKKNLWEAANTLRGSMSAESYMHVILGILSLKYISDKYELIIKKLERDGIDPLDVSSEDFFLVHDGFKINDLSNWNYILKNVKTNNIGQYIDDAILELEKLNPILKGIFKTDYNNETIDQAKLAEVVLIFNDENLCHYGEDIIGRIYEFFLGKFFRDRGQKGGEFYTPNSIVKLMVSLIDPSSGTIYDPCCGTGGMFIQCKNYLKSKKIDTNNIMVYGQESESTTWKLCALNLLLNNFPIKDNKNQKVLGERATDTFEYDQHKDKKFDYILANPPFNIKKWNYEKLKNDHRFATYGTPPKGNANYAWLLHILSKLSFNGKAAVILANGSLSSSQKDERQIRENLVKHNKVDAIIELPNKLFYTTQIPACIWILNNNKTNDNILMVNASNLEGNMLSKVLRELTEEDIEKVTKFFDNHSKNEIINEPGFAKTITINDLEENDYSFVPGRYIEIVEEKVDKQQLKVEIKELQQELKSLFKEINELTPKVEEAIEKAIAFEDDEDN